MSTKLQVINGGKKGASKPESLRPHVESRADGIYWVEPKTDNTTGEIINRESWLCSALNVVGIGIDDNKTRYLILRWQAFGAKSETVQAIPFADIGEREGWRTLKAGGVNVTTKSGLRATLADWLQSCANGEVWRIAHATAGSVAPISCPMVRSSVRQNNRCCLTGGVLLRPVTPPAVPGKAGGRAWDVWPLATIP